MADKKAQLTPEEVRRKWDELLNVINNVATTAGETPESPASASGRRPRGQLKAASELLSKSQSAGQLPGTPIRRGRPTWDDRHHLLYSTVNDRMQRNVRCYFDRPRDIDAYGTRYDKPLRTVWQLDTAVETPPPGAPMAVSPTSAANLERMATFSRNYSAPKLTGEQKRETRWDGRHHVLFAKDNHHLQANLREYFERPRYLHV
ncbi:unnamed protein product [Effrenium voratum]|nr:unnamed protein product [Effrenium voratum]